MLAIADQYLAPLPKPQPSPQPVSRIEPTLSLWVEPWVDEVIDTLGHDPKSAYVERFWLSHLGPSSTWLLRAMSYGFESAPTGFFLSPLEMARVLGIGERTGRYSPFQRSLGRLCHFGLAYERAGTYVARRRTPWLDHRQVQRLPSILQAEHQQWEVAEEGHLPAQAARRRAASLAFATIRTGGTTADAERILIRAQVHPSLSHTLAVWASQQYNLSAAARLQTNQEGIGSQEAS